MEHNEIDMIMKKLRMTREEAIFYIAIIEEDKKSFDDLIPTLKS